MKLRTFPIVLALLLALSGCDSAGDPQAEPRPTVIETPSTPPSASPTPTESPAILTGSDCPNEVEAVASGEPISASSFAEPDGGVEVDTEVVADPEAPIGCQVFLVATVDGVTSSNAIAGDIQLDLNPPQIRMIADVDGLGAPEAFVTVQSGASTQFGALFLLDPVRPVTFEDEQRAGGDLLAFGGSVTHLDGAACVPDERGSILVSTATSQGKRYVLERRFYRFDDNLLVEVGAEGSRESFKGLSRYPEFTGEPFANCPA